MIYYSSKLAGQLPAQKLYVKCLEFENNEVGRMTFPGWPTCQLGP